MQDLDRYLTLLMRGLQEGRQKDFKELAVILAASGQELQERGMLPEQWEEVSRRWIPGLCLQVSQTGFRIPDHPGLWIQQEVELLWRSWIVKIQRDRAAARDFQRRMQPPSPHRWRDLEIGAVVQPAEGLSGDLYDHAEVDDGFTVAMLDSMGHGSPAALHAIHTLGALRASLAHEPVPALLQNINQIMRRYQVGTEYASLVLARFDRDSHSVRIGNAGGIPPVLFADGAARTIQGGSYAVGALATHPGIEVTETLPSRGVLMLLSDGVCESEDANGSEFGLDRAVDVVRASLFQPAGLIAETVMDAVSAFTSTQLDDRTVVIVKRLPNQL
jgi:phosphoserine phosphatase RsbU/P